MVTYLTNERLIFEAHALNIQRGTTIIDLADIADITKVWTRFLNRIPLLPNPISIKTKDGTAFNLVVFLRDSWISAISATQ